MVITISGQCSFCGKDAREVFGLAGVLSRHARICNECIEICLEILMEDALRNNLKITTPLQSDHLLQTSASWDPFDFEGIGIMRSDVMRRIDVDLEAFMEIIKKHIDQSKSIYQSRPKDISHLACSFYDRNQGETKRLIAGTQTYICEVCTGDAAALIKMHR